MKNDELFSRVGKFTISRRFLYEFPEDVEKILQNVLIVQAEWRGMSDEVEYTGYSKMFEITEPGTIAPSYVFVYDGETKELFAYDEESYFNDWYIAENFWVDKGEGIEQLWFRYSSGYEKPSHVWRYKEYNTVLND